MKKIIVFDTSIGSQNLGDFIINELAEKNLKNLFKDNFVVKFSTHSPVLHNYQTTDLKKNNLIFKETENNKFIIGTNIIKKNMFKLWPDWNVNLFNCKPYKNSILVAAGLDNNSGNTNIYTKFLYNKILSKDKVHSVRDNETKIFLESLGYKVVNTGCVTLWGLTKDVCQKIPTKKKNKVVFTLTDYCQDKINDQKLIDILNNNYDEVYYWIQGTNDYEYFKSFDNIQNIKIINPSIKAFKEFLMQEEVDYVGTRLHAGIYAMNHFRRSIILEIDNRTRDMKKSFNINTIDRNNIDELEDMINNEIVTNINIDLELINNWMKQFI